MIDQSPSDRMTASQWVIPFMMLLGIAAALLLISFWSDVLDPFRSSDEATTFVGALRSVLQMDLEQARQTVGNMGEVMAAVLGLALTVSSIIVQLAATRFTPHVTTLFFRARTNLIVNGIFVIGTIFVLWVNYAANPQFVPRWGVLLSLLMLTASLLLLFPYFAYVFSFLEPESIIGRMASDGLRAATPIRSADRLDLETRQDRAAEAVENLANICLNATQTRDKNIASLAADGLCTFANVYGDTKAGMPKTWHTIPSWLRQSPDFVSLSDDAQSDLESRETWVEWKILRQYQMLFNEGLGRMKDLCYLIAINTKRLGAVAAERGDLMTVDLSIKFFNTYLRATINAADIRTAYNILHQYRQLAEACLNQARREATKSRIDELESRALEVARFMRYYSGIAFQRKMTFVTEVIAHDVGSLCEHAYLGGNEVHGKLLETFLRVDDTAESAEQEKTLRGVRRAQVKLAATYLVHKDEANAELVGEDMRDEPVRRLRSIWHELLALDSREFWEVNDRGTNFDYLTPAQKATLPRFFVRFPDLADEASESIQAAIAEVIAEGEAGSRAS